MWFQTLSTKRDADKLVHNELDKNQSNVFCHSALASFDTVYHNFGRLNNYFIQFVLTDSKYKLRLKTVKFTSRKYYSNSCEFFNEFSCSCQK